LNDDTSMSNSFILEVPRNTRHLIPYPCGWHRFRQASETHMAASGRMNRIWTRVAFVRATGSKSRDGGDKTRGRLLTREYMQRLVVVRGYVDARTARASMLPSTFWPFFPHALPNCSSPVSVPELRVWSSQIRRLVAEPGIS